MDHGNPTQPVISIVADSLKKNFGGNVLFRDVTIGLRTGQSLSVTGPNGAGKSTLLEIIAGIRSPSSGGVVFRRDNDPLPPNMIRSVTGFLSPRVNPYSELTGLENILFASGSAEQGAAEDLLRRFGMHAHRNKLVRLYSSGMRQRLKIILALLSDPGVLILDEPGSNLDAAGREILHTYLRGLKGGKILIIATNDEEEARLCDGGIRLG